MDIRKTFVAFIFSLFFVFSYAQKDSVKKITNKQILTGVFKTACDCKDAVKININKAATYGLTLPPLGYGGIQEITSKNKSDKLAFEKEHNSAWYLLNISFDGEFTFEVIPQDTANDYDFLLYKYTDSSFCNSLQKKLVKPLRSNLSRASGKAHGITGLSSEAKNEFVGQGIGTPFSKSINVSKGEKYILVLDNVYPNGQGHTLNFSYIKQVAISGIVLNADNIPVQTEISLTDNNGTIVSQLNTGKDGKYLMNAGLKEDLDYTLTFSADNSFIAIKTIDTKDLKQKNAFTDIKTVLPQLKKGSKYKMSSINFFGNEARLLPLSYSSVEALYKLMKKNKEMVIQIEGHVNGGKKGAEADEQTLSEERAKTVYDYLVNKGIDKKRISAVGYAATKMIYPNAKTETEGAANRRVEINVISIE